MEENELGRYPFEVCDPVAEALIAAVFEHGLAVLPRYLGDGDTLAAVAAEARRLLAHHPDHAQPLTSHPEGNGIRVERERAAIDCPRLAGVFDEPWMREVARTFFGDEPHVVNHDLMIVRDVVGVEHLAHQVHYDRMPQLKLFLYLSDTSVVNGAFRCLPGSHRYAKDLQRGNRRDLILPTSAETRLTAPELTTGLIPVEAPAGTLMVIDSDVAHRGSPIVGGERLSVRCRSYHPAYLARFAAAEAARG